MQTLLDLFPHDVSPWGYALVFFAAAAEAALFLGLVFPGETVLLIAGFLAWRGQGNLAGFMVAAITGAAVGDSIGYEIGRHFGPRLRRSRLGQRLGDERWERAGRYLREKGGRAVFLARFVTVIKTVVPALAGEARMPYRRFLVWNVAGAIVWGTLHVGIGYVAGQSIQTVDRYVGVGGWVLLGVLAVVGLAALLMRRRRADYQRATSGSTASPRR